MKKLGLKKETLAQLTADDLRVVAGGAEAASAGITYTCVCPTYTCGDIEIVIKISNRCLTNYCTVC